MWFLLFLFLSFSGCDNTIKDKGKLGQVICVHPQKYTEKSIFYGSVQALKSSPLVVQTDGVLIWTTHPGTEAIKSSIIAKIDNPQTQKVYELAVNAEAIANQQYKRSLSLSKSSAISQQQLQEREQAWIASQQDLAKADAEQKKSLFIAPFDGIMGPKLIHEGTHVKSGEIIGYFFNPCDIVVEVQVPADFKDHLKENGAVVINNKTYVLARVPKMLNPATHMLVVHIPVHDPTLLIGEVTDVEFHLKEWTDIILLPLGSIKFEDENTSVLVLKKGVLEKRDVTLGVKDAKHAVITKGIEPGEIICLDPHHFYEGEKITPSYARL